MQDLVYQTPIQDVADMRQCLLDTRSGFSQSIVDDAIDECIKDFRPKWMNREAILNTCYNTRTLQCRKLDKFLFV